MGALRGESRSLRHSRRGRSRLLDVRHEQGLSGTLRCRFVAAVGGGEVLLCARPPICQPRSRYHRLHGPEDFRQYTQRGSRTGRPKRGTAATPTEQGLRLALLGNDDETANREYTRQFVLDRDAEIGKRFGLNYGEAYHYIGPPPAKVDDYIRKNAVRL